MLANRLCRSASVCFILTLFYSYVTSEQKSLGCVEGLRQTLNQDPKHFLQGSNDRQGWGACSPKFIRDFGMMLISSIILYTWKIHSTRGTLLKLTFRPIIHNLLLLHGPPLSCMDSLHCGYQISEPSHTLVQQLSCRVVWAILDSLSQATLLNQERW